MRQSCRPAARADQERAFRARAVARRPDSWYGRSRRPRRLRSAAPVTLSSHYRRGLRAYPPARSAARTPTLPLTLPLRRRLRRSAGAKRNAGARRTASFICAGGSSLLPLPGLSGAGQNLSRPSVTAGQPHPSSCLASAHAKTALTEPARTRRWQLSEAGTRVAVADVSK